MPANRPARHSVRTSMSSKQARAGDAAFAKVDKVNAELLIFTYGALVNQLVKDLDSTEAVNARLDKLGYNMGLRLVEEFLAKSGTPRCQTFKEAMEVVSKIGFKMFLGVAASIPSWSQDEQECVLQMDENPLNEFVQLPEDQHELWYSNLLCGVVRGALEMVQFKVSCQFAKDVLRGDDASQIQVKLIEVLKDEIPPGEDG